MLRFVTVGLKVLLSLLVFAPFSALATVKPGPSPSDYMSVLLSLLLVIGVILGLAIFYKRMNFGGAGSQAIKVITALPVGVKERILVIEVNGQQHLLGVTPQQINHLVTLDEPIDVSNSGHAQLGSSFQKIFQGAKKHS